MGAPGTELLEILSPIQGEQLTLFCSPLACRSFIALKIFSLGKLPSSTTSPDILPGIIIDPHDSSLLELDTATTTSTVLPTASTLSLWGLNLASDKLLAGLRPWPSNPPIDESIPPLSSLGHFADNSYNTGPLTLDDYRDQLLEFVNVAFPKSVKPAMEESVARFLNSTKREDWDNHKVIWQTDKDEGHAESAEVATWKGRYVEAWKHDLVTDP